MNIDGDTQNSFVKGVDDMKTMRSFVSLLLTVAVLLSWGTMLVSAESAIADNEKVIVELGSYQWQSNSGVENGYGFSMTDATKTALANTSWFGTVAAAGDYGRWTRATGNVLVDGVETEVNIVIQASQSALFIGNSVKYLTEGHTIVIPKENIFTVNRTYGGTLNNGGQIQFAKTYKLTYDTETGKPVLGFEPEAKEKVTVELGAYNGTTGTATDWNGYAYKVSEATSTALAATSWVGTKGTTAGNYTTWTSATGTILVDGVETEGRIVFRAYNWDIHLLTTVKYLTEGHTVVFPKDSVFTVDRTYGGTLANGGQVQFAENYQLTYDTATSKPVLSVVVEEDPLVTAGVAWFADADNYADHYYGAFGGVTRDGNTVKILANEAGGHIGFRLTKTAIKSMIDAGYKTVEFKMTTAAYEEGNIPTYINAFAFGVYPSTYQSSYTNATVQGTDAYYASGSVLKLDLVELYYNGLTDGLRFILKNNNGGGGANGAPAYVVLSDFQFTKDDVAETPIGQMTLAASYENGENGEFGGVTAIGENGAQILANATDGIAGFELKRSAVEKLLTFGVNEMTFTLNTAAYNGGAVPGYVVLDAAAEDYIVNCETVAAKIDGSKLYFAAGTQITIRLQKLYADMTYTDGLEFVLLNGDTWESGSETAYLTLSGLTFEEKLEKLDLDLVTTNADFTSYYASEGSWLDITKASVRAVAEAGFKYVDLTLYDLRNDHILMQDGWEDIIAELKTYADECGVEFRQAHSPGYTTHGSEEWVNTNKRCIEICQILGIENLVSHTSSAKSEGGTVVNYSKAMFFENNTANYALILPYAAEKGVNILCENASYVSMAYGWSVNTGADMREFVKYVQTETGYTNIHACWDVGHANCEGDQYLDIIALGDEMYGIHFHDNTGADTHLMPYYGNLDIAAVMRAIKMIGYNGDFTLEADGASRSGGTYTGPELEGELDPYTTDCFEQEDILYQIAEYILKEYDCGEPVKNDTVVDEVDPEKEKVTVELTGYAGFYTSTNNGADVHFAFAPSTDTKTALAATKWFKGNTTSNDYGKLTTLTGKILVDGVEETATIKFNVSGSGMYLEMSKTYLEAGKIIVIPSENIFTVTQSNGGTIVEGAQIQFAKNYKLTYDAVNSKPILGFEPDAKEKVTVELGVYNGMSQSGVENGYAYKASDATKAALAETSWFGYTSGGGYGQWTRATGMILVDGVETEVNIVIKSSNMDVNIANTVAYLTEGKTVIIPKNNIFTVNRTYGGTLDNGGQIQFAENYKLTYNASTSKPVLSVATATVVDGTEYLHLQTAVDAAIESGKTMTLQGDVADEAVTVEESETLSLDLNGYSATINGGTLALTDSATDNGELGGKVYGTATVAQTVTKASGISYVAVPGSDENGNYYTANAVRVKVKRINIRPSSAGIYFTTEVIFNQNIADLGATYGVAVSIVNKPEADFATDADTRWTSFAAPTGANFADTGTSTIISNIIKNDGSSNVTNSARGTMDIYANAYVMTKVGNEDVVIMMENTTDVVYSLQKVMQGLDPSLKAYAEGTGELSENAAKALNFYEAWEGVMTQNGWNLTNMALALAKKNAA